MPTKPFNITHHLPRPTRHFHVGRGDSAVDWTNTLAPITAQQTLIHRRDTFSAHEDTVQQLKHTPTRILPFHELKAIGGNSRIEVATVYYNRTKDEHTIDIDAVLVNGGFSRPYERYTEPRTALATDGAQMHTDKRARRVRSQVISAFS
ncbi:MAG: hypothetical protein NTU53_13170 [Planctomycetota bacterium]|nr:hypothetical protein [Planctomycetota bacterium]